MTDTTPPKGAIIPPKIGEIGLDLPDGWWLMHGGDAGALPDGWESIPVSYWAAGKDGERRGWLATPVSDNDPDLRHFVRRRIVKVTVDARPGDWVVVMSSQAMDGIRDFGYGARRTPGTDAFQDAIDKAVVAE